MALTFTIFGGGGKVAKHFTKLAVTAGHKVHSVIKDDGHASELDSLGATTHILSLHAATPSTISSLFRQTKPDVVLFSAGAGGKPPGADEIDHKGAVKVFDAMEQAGVKRLVLVGALDVRSRDKGWPEWYNEEDKKASDKVWGSIGSCTSPPPLLKLKLLILIHQSMVIRYASQARRRTQSPHPQQDRLYRHSTGDLDDRAGWGCSDGQNAFGAYFVSVLSL